MATKNVKSIANLFDAYVEKMTDANWDKFVARVVVRYSETHKDWDLMAIVEEMVHLRRFHGSGLTSWDTVFDVRVMLCKYGLVSENERQSLIANCVDGWANVGNYEEVE